MKIGIVMPVTQVGLAAKLLVDMDKNTIKPVFAAVFDDSDKGFTVPEVSYRVECIRYGPRHKRWPGINGFWNMGVRKMDGMDFVTIINDDMTIHPFFFEMAIRSMLIKKDAAVSCPLLVATLEEVGGSNRNLQIDTPNRREGGAFTFRKPVLDQIPPIPGELVVYFGDDWYWGWTEKLGWKWVKVMNSKIYHHGSLGIKQRNLRSYLKSERQTFINLACHNRLPMRLK